MLRSSVKFVHHRKHIVFPLQIIAVPCDSHTNHTKHTPDVFTYSVFRQTQHSYTSKLNLWMST
jgi:hypothetical protein